MAINPEIEPALKIFKRRIAELQRAMALLEAEAGATAPEQRKAQANETGSLFSAGKHSAKGKKTRKQTLVAFLKENGPTPRRLIVEKTGLPPGTIAFTLNDKKTFVRHDDGRWDIRRPEGEQAKAG